jgi:hypothetical protein
MMANNSNAKLMPENIRTPSSDLSGFVARRADIPAALAAGGFLKTSVGME